MSFAYLNARVRSRRSEQVADGFFQQALSLSFPDFLRTLGETIYGPDLIGDTLADVDQAVAKHLGRTVMDLPGLVQGGLRELVSLPLMRSDLANLKTILRGKAAGKSLEEIKTGLVGGTLKEPLVAAMLQANDAAGIAQALSIPGHPLAKALRGAATASDPLAMEVALDRDFFAYSLEKAKKLRDTSLTAYFVLDVDATNLSTAFKLQALGAQAPEEYFVPGGKLVNQALFNRLAAGDMSALDSLNGTALANAAAARDLPSLELALRKVLLERAAKGSLDAMGGGLVLDFIRRKEWEAARIRLLARRAYFDLPADAVAKEIL
jgi:V/A-type H+/Na+-transporting ATPase subunit C